MCTVLLPPGVNPTAVNKTYHVISKLFSPVYKNEYVNLNEKIICCRIRICFLKGLKEQCFSICLYKLTLFVPETAEKVMIGFLLLIYWNIKLGMTGKCCR